MKREPNLCSILLLTFVAANKSVLRRYSKSVCIVVFVVTLAGHPPPPRPLHASARRQAAKEDEGEGQCDTKLLHDENEGCRDE